jgi:predicted nucleotidyltransferase
MRLTHLEQQAIKQTILEADPGAQVFLFGSRVDDTKKGGDIDLLVLSRKLGFDDKLKIKGRLAELIGEQRIDLVIASDTTKPFVRIALEQGVEL